MQGISREIFTKSQRARVLWKTYLHGGCGSVLGGGSGGHIAGSGLCVLLGGSIAVGCGCSRGVLKREHSSDTDKNAVTLDSTAWTSLFLDITPVSSELKSFV